MSRAKKEGEKISLYLEKDTVARIRAYAEEKGQTVTMAMERILRTFLDAEKAGKANQSR